MTDDSPLLLDVKDGIATLTINRPDVRNAIDEDTMAAFEVRLGTIEADDSIRVVVLTGAGDAAFCAGGDLNWFKSLTTQAEGRCMSERMRAITDRLADGDLPLITVANGAAVGGGVELFMCGHVRIAVRSARFRYVQSKVGVVTGWGGGARSLEALGPDVFRLMTIGDRALDAAEAREWGLVHDVVPALSLHDDVYGMARDIAALDQGAVRGFLDLTRTWVRKGRDATSQRELDLFTELWPPEW